MLNLQEIENTIDELENGDTTFDACIKLAALYNVREHFKGEVGAEKVSDKVTKELADILPHYEAYIEAKRSYQLNKISEETVIEYMSTLCVEIDEFIHTLYISTDTPQERFLLHNSLLQTTSKISS